MTALNSVNPRAHYHDVVSPENTSDNRIWKYTEIKPELAVSYFYLFKKYRLSSPDLIAKRIGQAAYAFDHLGVITALSLQSLGFLQRRIRHFIPPIRFIRIFRLIEHPLNLLWLITSAFEFLFEGYHVLRSYKLLRDLKTQEHPFEKLYEEMIGITPSEEEELCHFLTNQFPHHSKEMHDQFFAKVKEKIANIKQNRLVTYGGDWFAEKIRTASVQDTQKIIQLAKTQLEKKIIFHLLGTITVAISLLSMVLLLVESWPILIFLMILASTTLGIGKYLLKHGVISHEGWSLSFQSCIPPWIKSVCSRVNKLGHQFLNGLQIRHKQA